MSIEKYRSSSLMRSQSVSGMAGKGLVAAGTGAIVLSVLAALIPFVGVLGLGVILLALGVFMWE